MATSLVYGTMMHRSFMSRPWNCWWCVRAVWCGELSDPPILMIEGTDVLCMVNFEAYGFSFGRGEHHMYFASEKSVMSVAFSGHGAAFDFTGE